MGLQNAEDAQKLMAEVTRDSTSHVRGPPTISCIFARTVRV